MPTRTRAPLPTWLFAGLLAGFAAALHAQASEAPADLLADAASRIGIDPAQAPPFHLKAHFDTFNADGKPDGSGTFEEFSDGKDRLVTHTTFRGAEYRVWQTPEVRTSGAALRQAFFANRLVEALTHPIPTSSALKGAELSEKTTKFGSTSLDCVKTARVLTPAKGSTNPFGPDPWLGEEHNYCVSPDQHLLRVAEAFPGLNFVYNQFESFAGRQVPHTIAVGVRRVLRGKFIVDSLETWSPENSIFTPPADASNPFPAASPLGWATGGGILSKDGPVYPPMAKSHDIKGRVALAITITPEGAVTDIQIIDSPNDLLNDAATDCVKQWKYKPFLHNGVPVSVTTIVTIGFGV